MKVQLSIDEWLEEEKAAISRFIHFFQEIKDTSKVIYEVWDAKDVLGHITSWHVSFANNLLAAVENTKPNPFRGSLTEVNERGVAEMSQHSVGELLGMLKTAQDLIEKNIKNPAVKEIVYRKGSRNYSPIEHLEVVARHVQSHLNELIKKYAIKT